MQMTSEVGSEGPGSNATRTCTGRSGSTVLRGSGAWAFGALSVLTVSASVLSTSCSCDSDHSSGSAGGGHGGAAGNVGQSGSSATGDASGGSGASAAGAGGTEDGGEGGWSGGGGFGGGAGTRSELGEAGGASGASGASGAAPWNEGWDFCTAQASAPPGSADLTVTLSDRVWCTRTYTPSNEDLESGEDLLAKSLRRAAQARPVAGEYPASSDATELELPWCVRSRTATGSASAPGSLEIRTSSSIHDQPVLLGAESVEIRSGLRVVAEEGMLQGPTDVSVVSEDAFVFMRPCEEVEGAWRVIRSYELAEGSISFETRLADDNGFMTVEETWVKAWGEFAGSAFEVTDFFNFAAVEMSGTGDILELGVLLDAPIGDVCGFRVDLGGLSEQFFATDCNLAVLRELELTASSDTAEELP